MNEAAGKSGEHLPPALALAEKVALLCDPRTYALPLATSIEAVETRMSWLFLTPERVYKLKKPLREPLFDFSSLAQRRLNCETELRLNRRLAAEVYLDVVRLTLNSAGECRIEGEGETLDYLVMMRRLPKACSLDQLIVARTIPFGAAAILARRLCDFYRVAEKSPRSPAEYVAHFRERIGHNHQALVAGDYPLPRQQLDHLHGRLLAYLDRHEETLRARSAQGRIIEGHGDLRPEHVYLIDRHPLIIDCLEFSRELRLLDPIDELSLLSLECARLGAPGFGQALIAEYQTAERDPVPDHLIAFYHGYRALLWSRLAIRHLDQLERRLGDSEKWCGRARFYLHQAELAVKRQEAIC